MKILVDKMPNIPSSCLFSYKEYGCIKCMLTKRWCVDTTKCKCLKVDFMKKELHTGAVTIVPDGTRPCLCGSKDLIISHVGNSFAALHFVYCRTCGREGEQFATEKEALDSWNEMMKPEDELHISYICDRKRECGKDGCRDCNNTSDIEHAANFTKFGDGFYVEKERAIYTPFMYQKQAAVTADPMLSREKALVEGLVGINSEAGEALDIWKKHEFHDHELDKKAIALELGDTLWYLTEAAVALGYSLEDIMKMNIEKLEKRYPNGFDPERSKNREVCEIGSPGTPGWENG